MSDKPEAKPTAAPKAPARARTAVVEVQNRTRRAVTLVKINGEGLHLAPRAVVTVAQKEISADFERVAKLGQIRLTAKEV